MKRLSTRFSITPTCLNVCCVGRQKTKTSEKRLTFKPPRDKTKKVICALSEDSDRPGPAQSFCAQWVAKDPSFLHADSEDSDQTGRMPRLIWVFAGRTGHFDGFVMTRFILLAAYLIWVNNKSHRMSLIKFKEPKGNCKTVYILTNINISWTQPNSKDSSSLIRAFAIHLKKLWVIRYTID